MIELGVVLRIVLCSIATYRLAELITVDRGPGAVFQNLRRYLGKESHTKIGMEIALLFNCPFCIGVWIGFLMSFLVFFPSSVGDIVLIVLGIIGGQALLSSIGARYGSND